MSHQYTLYHNPRCSKSRATLALLNEKGIDPEIILYLNAKLSESDIKAIVKALGLSLNDVIRKKEAVYAELGLGRADDKTLLRAIAENPILLERPILIVDGKKAAIGRPPENILTLL